MKAAAFAIAVLPGTCAWDPPIEALPGANALSTLAIEGARVQGGEVGVTHGGLAIPATGLDATYRLELHDHLLFDVRSSFSGGGGGFSPGLWVRSKGPRVRTHVAMRLGSNIGSGDVWGQRSWRLPNAGPDIRLQVSRGWATRGGVAFTLGVTPLWLLDADHAARRYPAGPTTWVHAASRVDLPAGAAAFFLGQSLSMCATCVDKAPTFDLSLGAAF